MSLNLEAEKLQAKIDWLKEHLNTKKTAEKLDAEFEVWYKEEKVKKEEQKIRDELTAQIKQEQNLWFDLDNKNSPPMSYETYADLRITRVCTLQAFANVILLQSLTIHSELLLFLLPLMFGVNMKTVVANIPLDGGRIEMIC